MDETLMATGSLTLLVAVFFMKLWIASTTVPDRGSVLATLRNAWRRIGFVGASASFGAFLLPASAFAGQDDLCRFTVEQMPIVATCEFFEATNFKTYFYLSMDTAYYRSLMGGGQSQTAAEQVMSALAGVAANAIRNSHSFNAVVIETLQAGECLELAADAFFFATVKSRTEGKELSSLLVEAVKPTACPSKSRE